MSNDLALSPQYVSLARASNIAQHYSAFALSTAGFYVGYRGTTRSVVSTDEKPETTMSNDSELSPQYVSLARASNIAQHYSAFALSTAGFYVGYRGTTRSVVSADEKPETTMSNDSELSPQYVSLARASNIAQHYSAFVLSTAGFYVGYRGTTRSVVSTDEKPETTMSNDSGLSPQYVSLTQASNITQLSSRTLRRAIAAQRLRAHHLGRLIRIELCELERWVKSGGIATLPPARPGSRA